MTVYSKLAPSKKITDTYTLRKQIGSNVFKRQPQSNFQYGNFMSEYYKNRSYYYYGNKQSPYISQASSGGGGAGGSGGGYADESSGVPPWIQNPNKSETEQAWNIVRAEMAERFGNLKNWIQNANENGFKSENAYGITMKDITTLIPETHQELFINSLNILKDPSSSYTDKQTALNSLTFVVGVAEKDLGNNVAFTDPQTGISYTWNDYLGNPGDQASWKMHSGDLDYTIYMLLNTPYLVTDKYDRSVLEATLTDIHNGNPFSIQQGNATIDVLDRVLTPENMIKVEEQKFYAGALQELKDMDTSGMNKYHLAEHDRVINLISNKASLSETDINYIKDNTLVGDFYDSVKTIETDIGNAQQEIKKQVKSFLPPRTPNPDKVAGDVAAALVQGLPTTLTALQVIGMGSNINDTAVENVDKGLFPTNMNDLTKGQRESVMQISNENRRLGYEEQSKGNSVVDKVYGFLGNILSTRVNPITQSEGGTDPLANQYNPAFYQGYTAQMTSGLGNTPQEKSQAQSSAGIKDYYNTRSNPSVTNFGDSFVSGNDAYSRALFGVNAVGDKEAPTVGDYLQLGLTVYDILTLGVGRGALFGVTNVGKGAGALDDGAKTTRSFFSFFKRSGTKIDEADDILRPLTVQSREEVAEWWGKGSSKIGEATKEVGDDISHGIVKGKQVWDSNVGKYVNFKDFSGNAAPYQPGKYFKGFNEKGIPQFSILKDYTLKADNAKAEAAKQGKSVFNYATQAFEPVKEAVEQVATKTPKSNIVQTTETVVPQGRGITQYLPKGLNPDNPPGITHVPMNLLRDIKAGYTYATQHPGIAMVGGSVILGTTDILGTWAFQNFYIGDTLQQSSQYNISNMIKGQNPTAWGQSQAMLKNAILFQDSVSYKNAQTLSAWRETPILNLLYYGFDTITAGSLTRGINQFQTYQGIITGNVALLQERGLVYDVKYFKDGTVDISSLKYRDPDSWNVWYKTEGKNMVGNNEYGLKGECDYIYSRLNHPNKEVRDLAREQWNTQANTNVKSFTDLGYRDVFSLPFSNKSSGLASAETNFQDVKPGQMSESQRILSDVLNKATDISQVKQVADRFGLNIEGRMKFTTDKSLEGYKNAVLTVARDNENSPFTIDRRDKTVYAPPVTTQNRTNYFTKVNQPQTIKWNSKYVPQAATYGGQGAFNYQQPTVDPSWSVNVGDTDRPWLGTGQDVFSWSNNLPITSQADYNAMVQQEQDRIKDAFFTPTVIDQTWGFAQLIAEINYNPIDNLKKDKKR